MEANIKTQKFGISQLLSLGWQLYRNNFKAIFMIIFCVYLPILIVVSFIPVDGLTQEYDASSYRFVNQISNMLVSLVGLIATIGIAALIDHSLEGKDLHWSDALRFGVSKWLSAFGTGLLGGLIIFGLTLLLIVPGIIWSLYYIFAIYVVALRNLSRKSALDYSKNLVEGQWWRIFGINFILSILCFLFVLGVNIPASWISTNQVFVIIPDFFSNLIGSFFTVVTILFFLNNDYLKHPALDQGEQSAPELMTPQV